jgi:hypothetical protein
MSRCPSGISTDKKLNHSLDNISDPIIDVPTAKAGGKIT